MIARVQNLCKVLFDPKIVHPTLSLRIERIFLGLSVRELRTQSWNDYRTEGPTVGARHGFLILWHPFGHGFSRKKRRGFRSACAMTTKFLDNQICTFKILLSWRFPRKIAFCTISLYTPNAPPTSKLQILFLLSSRRFWIFFRSLARIFQPSFPVPRQIHAPRSMPLQFWNPFPISSSGCLTLVCVAAVRCRYF